METEIDRANWILLTQDRVQ